METPNQIKYHIATREEGQKLLASNTEYYSRMNQADIEWRLKKEGATIDDLKAYAQECVVDFSPDEIEEIKDGIEFVEQSLRSLGFTLPFPQEDIVLVRTTMNEEGGAEAYTHKTEIYLGEEAFDNPYTPFNDIIAHELFHCLTRHSPEFRRRMYSLIGFTILDHELPFSTDIQNKILINPDVEHLDNYAEFTIEGKKCNCELIVIYTRTYREAKEMGRKYDSFFQHICPVLVPIDTLNTCIPISWVPDFLDKVGRNTPYQIAPEEILADNFKEVILQKNVDDFPSPEILRNMIAALKEFKP